MTKNEFIRDFCLILDTYGEKYYPVIRQNIIFEYVKNLNSEEFLYGINLIIGSEKYPPMLNEFKKYFDHTLITHAKNIQEENHKNNPCFKCNSSGILLQKQKYGMADIAFQCTCENGKKFYPHFPKFRRSNVPS